MVVGYPTEVVNLEQIHTIVSGTILETLIDTFGIQLRK